MIFNEDGFDLDVLCHHHLLLFLLFYSYTFQPCQTSSKMKKLLYLIFFGRALQIMRRRNESNSLFQEMNLPNPWTQNLANFLNFFVSPPDKSDDPLALFFALKACFQNSFPLRENFCCF